MLNMYKGKINSPQTTLTSAINSTQTSIVVANASVLLTSPNLAVIGGETDSPETVQVTNIASNTLTVVRGFEGTAQSWGSGVKVGRNFTAYDYNTLVDNVDDLSVNKFDSIDFVDTVPTKSNVETALGFTVNKSVPANAIFTDTVYSHPLTHPYNMLTDTPTIPSVVGLASETYVNNKVRTDVPIGALFTDTTTSINSKTGVILKADVVALGIPAQDTVVDITGKVDKAGDSITGNLSIAGSSQTPLSVIGGIKMTDKAGGAYLENANTWGMKWKFAGDADTVEMNSGETAWKFNVADGGVTKYRFSSSKAGSILGPIVDFNLSGSSIFYGNVGIGRTTPSEKLDILGNIAVSGTVDGVDILAEKNRLANTSGTNTGDQDLSGLIPKSGGTFTGTAIGNNNTSYTTSQLRNARIYADGATIPTLANGEIAFIYEV